MLTLAMLFYIGLTLNAPVWYWVCWGLKMFFMLIEWGCKLIKIGRDSK